MNKLICFALLAVLCFAESVYANDGYDSKKKRFSVMKKDLSASKMKPFIIGGVAGVTFGDYTEVRLSPLIGYRLSKEITAEARVTYRHSWDKQVTSSQEEVTAQDDSFGGGLAIQYNPVKEFYMLTEYSRQTYTTETTQGNISDDVNFLFLGLGYTNELSKDVFLDAGIKVDLLNDTESPFADFTPFFDVGIRAGL